MKPRARAPDGDSRASRRLRRANNSLQWQDVDAAACSTGSDASGLAKLPLSIISDRVFPYLAPPPSLDNINDLRDGIDAAKYKERLVPLGIVCQQWYKLTQLLERACGKHEFAVDFRTGTKDERMKILKAAKRDGKDAKQLTVSMGHNEWFGPFRMYIAVADEDLNLDQAWWDALFQCFPNLLRLDLTHTSKSFIPMVLLAASRFSRHMQALQFQFAQGRPPDEDAGRHARSMTALEDALRGWHDATGGLRSLTIPRWVYTEAEYTRFISAVASYCPNAEYVRHTGGNHPLTSHAMTLNGLEVPKEVWAEFSRRCTKLREFSWKLVTFDIDHGRSFVAHPKPMLEVLDVEIDNGEWWQDMTDLSIVMAMIDTAPKLRTLLFTLFEARVDPPLSPNALTELALRVANQCPQIEICSLRDAVHGVDARNAIKGVAIEALTRSGTMLDLFLNNVSLGEQTLVAVLENLCNGRSCERHVDLRSDLFIFVAILPLLQYVADAPVEKFEKTTLELTVSGMTRRNMTEPEITTEQQQQLKLPTLKKLVEAIKKKHKNALSHIRVTMRPVMIGNKTVKVIDEFHLLLNVKPKRKNEYLSLVGVEISKTNTQGGVFDKKQTRMCFYERL